MMTDIRAYVVYVNIEVYSFAWVWRVRSRRSASTKYDASRGHGPVFASLSGASWTSTSSCLQLFPPLSEIILNRDLSSNLVSHLSQWRR